MSTIGNKEYSVEFNDSVFESQAWKKSRYEGKELSGAQINKYTTGDVSYGNTPVIRNVSRNIYIGNAIIPLGDTAASGDETLVQFPSSSYITIQKYITINSDDSISENNFDGSDLDSKNGFYRSFYEDFPIGDNFQLKLLDESATNFTLDNYNVIFNLGKLHINGHQVGAGTVSVGSIVGGITSNIRIGTLNQSPRSTTYTSFTVNNNQFTQTFYTGSYTGLNTYADVIDGFVTALINSTRGAENISNRYFLTFTSTSAEPLAFKDIEITTPTKIADFCTAEIAKGGSYAVNEIISFTRRFRFSKGIDEYTGGANSSPNYGYVLSKLNNSTPSILTNLFKPEQLPGDVGNLPFIVIPSNLHPYIKDNLLYFLGQAGIDIGNRRIPNQLDGQNRKLT